MISMNPMVFCMIATPFTEQDTLDEGALRANLRRMVEAGLGVYLGSGGAGEGHALQPEELARVYAIGVEECKGRVPVCANPPEPRTARAMIETCRLAAKADVDLVQIYPMDAGHAMRPTFAEQEQYYRDVLDAIDHPIALSVHVYSGYITPIALLKRLCAEYPKIRALNIMGTPLAYLQEVRDEIGRGVAVYIRMINIVEGLTLGMQGSLAAEPNLVPRLCRSVVDHFQSRDMDACGRAMADLVRFAALVDRWSPSTARWVKMGMRVLDLPGGGGGLRRPYIMPPDSELAQMAEGFERLGVRQWEAMR